MLSDEQIDELLTPAFGALRSAVRAAYKAGSDAGSQALINTLLESAARLFGDGTAENDDVLKDVPVPVDPEQEPEDESDDGNEAATRRAPKGLVDDVLQQVLADRPGMSQDEVEDAVVTVDPRIAKKSVYNKLRWWEKQGRRYRRHEGRWYRIADLPPPWTNKSSPQGETGGGDPPASLDLLDKAGQPDGPRSVAHDNMSH
jgi:hypothetical protein